jgi:hypothetical protein
LKPDQWLVIRFNYDFRTTKIWPMRFGQGYNGEELLLGNGVGLIQPFAVFLTKSLPSTIP